MARKHLLPNITLASKVTLCRIAGIPVFILLMIYYEESLRTGAPMEGYRIAALILFIVIAATDALDGYLARSRNEVTHLGRILDPLADKGLVLSALLLLTRPSLPELQPQFPIFATLIVLSRDVILVAGAILIRYHSGSVHVQPRWTGKLATALLMINIAWALADFPVQVFDITVWVMSALILISGVQYAIDGILQLEHELHEHRDG